MTTPPGLPARALIAAADEALTEASFLTADFAAAERLFTEARDLATQHGDRDGEALALTGFGMAQHGRNITRLVSNEVLSDADVATEEELMRRALTAWQQTGDAAGTARALFGVSLVFQVLRQDWDAGMPSLWQALGQAELAAGEPRRAAEHLFRAVELARAAGLLPWRIRDAEQNLAEAEAAVRAAG
jgi:hypothetical protein